ncbi:MAG: ketoacyl-ACP synthase III [Bacteroidia bacterium]
MGCFAIDKVKIAGISACVPKHSESNSTYTEISEAERKLFIKTTGIESRRMAAPGVTTSDLCFAAAEKLIAELRWKKEDIGLIIFVSQSKDYFLPATSIILQDRLKLSKSTVALDIGLGCSGYINGLFVASGLMRSASIQKALVMVGDISTSSLARSDKSTYPLFGDAGSVTALEITNDPAQAPWYFNLYNDGSGYETIIIPDGCVRNPLNEESFKFVKHDEGIVRSRRNLWLNGLDVFTFSIREVPPSVEEILAYSHTAKERIDYFVMHQANLLMNETIRKKLKFPAEAVPYSLADFGNTSSASIPLTIVTKLREKAASSAITLLCSGFGVGLSWGNVILNTDRIVCPELIEI